jgi:hypothetical protein
LWLLVAVIDFTQWWTFNAQLLLSILRIIIEEIVREPIDGLIGGFNITLCQIHVFQGILASIR